MFNNYRREVVVRFVDIGGIVDHRYARYLEEYNYGGRVPRSNRKSQK
jgi:hypothetical protein